MTKIDITKELEVYKKSGANLLMPSTQIEGLSEFHAPVIDTVKLSANPDEGDVYKQGDEENASKQKYRLTKQALMKLSVVAGIIWSTEHSRRVDDGKNRDYVCYQAVGGLRKSDGTPIYFKAQYDIDFEVLAEQLKELYEGKTKGKWAEKKTAKEKSEYVDFCVRRDLLQKRQHKLKLAESGAMNRVVREILGLKNAYTAAELQQPFVMMRIVFRPDYSDKDVKSQILKAHIQAMTGVYGQAALDSTVTKENDIIDVTPTAEVEHEEIGAAPESVKQTVEESMLVDFNNTDDFGQCKSLTTMALQKGYNLQDFMTRAKAADLTAFARDKRANLFKHLLGMPDKNATPPLDDVPY